MAGFMEMLNPTFLGKIFGGKWREVFVVLSDIGLFGFKDRYAKKCYFMPLKGASLVKGSNNYDREYVIVIICSD